MSKTAVFRSPVGNSGGEIPVGKQGKMWRIKGI